MRVCVCVRLTFVHFLDPYLFALTTMYVQVGHGCVHFLIFLYYPGSWHR